MGISKIFTFSPVKHEVDDRSMALRAFWKFISPILAVFGLLAVAGCALPPEQTHNDDVDMAAESDPQESANRAMFAFNRTLDGLLLRPVTQIYRGVVPEEGRECVSNALRNLSTPVVLFNSVLQGDADNSFATLWRFLLNSSFGVAGMFDFAKAVGLENRNADFGQTLAVYGAEPGGYVVLPIIGPSSGRDFTGRIVDLFVDPLTYVDGEWVVTRGVFTALDRRSANMKVLDDIYFNSIDPYATMRSGYLQKRAAEIRSARRAIAASRAIAAKETIDGGPARP